MRGSRQGDSHGGLYLVDMAAGAFEQVLDWNTCDIDFEGRGADRGLRGIAAHGGHIYVAASDELFVFSRQFKIVSSFSCPALKHCHEICEHRGSLYLTSTGCDSILRYSLASKTFDLGVRLARVGNGLGTEIFDPASPVPPPATIEFHLNSVFVDDTGVFVAGRKLNALVQLTPDSLSIVTGLPFGTHNARPFGDGVLANLTEQDCLTFVTPTRKVSIPVPRYAESDLLCTDFDESGLARQAFGRGLCPLSDHLVAGGSSPTTVSIYDLAAEQRLQSVNLSMDVRNAAHGLAIWPY